MDGTRVVPVVCLPLTPLVTGSSDCCIVKVALEWSGVGGAATGRKSDS